MTSRVVVVGAGATGLVAAGELARRGVPVDLVSLGAARRSVVASSADAIAVAQGDDDVAAHAADAAFARASEDEAAALRALVAGGREILSRLAALGVPFAREADGAIARWRAGGHRGARLVSSGPNTKREIVSALDDELARLERAHPGRVRRLEGWEVVAIATCAGACVGVVAQDLRSMEIHGVPARAVLLASGGFAGAWASTTAPSAMGSATAAAARAGAELVDLDAVEVVPIAVVARARRHPVSELVRAAGARVWVPLDATEVRRGRDVPAQERRVLLPTPADGAEPRAPGEAARVLARALHHEDAGIFDPKRGALDARVYVDLVHLAPTLRPEQRAEIDRVARVTGVDLLAGAAAVAPAIHDTLGGLFVRFARGADGALDDGSPTNHATTLPGLYAAGSAAGAYHGALRLPGHRLLEGLFGGALAARSIVAYRAALDERTEAEARAVEAAERDARATWSALLARRGDASAHVLRAELGAALDALVGLASPGRALDVDGFDALAARIDACGAGDVAPIANRGAVEVRRLEGAWLLARTAEAMATARAQSAASGTPDESEPGGAEPGGAEPGGAEPGGAKGADARIVVGVGRASARPGGGGSS